MDANADLGDEGEDDDDGVVVGWRPSRTAPGGRHSGNSGGHTAPFIRIPWL